MTSTEYVLDKNNQLVVVYLSQFGCLEYTETILKGLQHMDPFIICCKENENRFSEYKSYAIETPKTKWSMAIESVSFPKKVSALMDKLKNDKPIELLIPAFHPWNNLFINWAYNNGISNSLVVHDFYTHKGESSKLIESLQRKAISAATRVIFLSKAVKDQATKAIGSIKNYTVIPHPIIDAGIINSLPYNSKPNLLFLGRGRTYKGLNLLIEAIEDLPITQLTIAGELGMNIPKHPKLNIINKYLSKEEIKELLSTHEILVLPYTEASQSGILTLGISAKMVMVITAVGGLPEQLGKDMAIWVEPTTESIKAGLWQTIENEEDYSRVKSVISKHKN